jgi:hypothetical protein
MPAFDWSKSDPSLGVSRRGCVSPRLRQALAPSPHEVRFATLVDESVGKFI